MTGRRPPSRRRPALLHFALAGAALFGVDALFFGAATPERAVVVVRVAADATPDAVERAVDEAVLVEAALSLGWAETDPLVSSYLAENLRYARPELADEPDAALLAMAFELDLVRADPIVRRRLADRALRVVDGRRVAEPDDEALAAWLAAHSERFSRAARLHFGHAFVSRERRGERLEADAAALLARLHSEDVAAEAGASHGDPSLLARPAEVAALDVLDRTWGDGLGAALADAPLGAWSGPYASSFGLHLVRPTARIEARVPELAEIRAAVRADWLEDTRARARAAHLTTLRATWPVSIEVVAP